MRHRSPERTAAAPALRALALAVVVGTAVPAAAQPAVHSAWGGPDSPGGLFGGDPLDADTNRDQRVTHDEFWVWLRGRADAADANRDSQVTPTELGIAPTDRRRQAWFRSADTDRSGSLSAEELRMFSGMAFRFHDLDQDGALARHEVRRPAAARQQRAGQGATGQGATGQGATGQGGAAPAVGTPAAATTPPAAAAPAR